MARYKYLGEPPQQGFTMSDMFKLQLPTKSGAIATYLPVAPATQFVVGADLGYDFTEQFSVLALESDPRFQKIA